MAGRRGWGRAAGVAAASVVVAVLAVGGLAGLPPGVWDSWTPASCLPDACFCEAVGAGPVRQPINAWSSLAFVPVGLWAAFGAGRGRGGAGTMIVAMPTSPSGSPRRHESRRVNSGVAPFEAYQRWLPIHAVSNSTFEGRP